MRMAAQYEMLTQLAKAGIKLDFGQDLFVKFYQAFIASNRWQQYLKGVIPTLYVTAIALTIGVVLGSVVALVRVAHDQQRRGHHDPALAVANAVCKLYATVIRGTPMMVQAMFIYYGLAQLFNIHLGTMEAALFIVSINTGAYMAETVRGGILSIDPGQTEGAKAIGMTHVQTMNAVILPQALRNIMPQIGNNLIINIKDTCVLSVIGTVELFFATKSVAGAMYTYFEAFTITMAIYFVLTFSCSRLLRLCESKMDGPDSYELYDLATTDTLAHTTGLYSYPKKPRENTHNNDIMEGGR